MVQMSSDVTYLESFEVPSGADIHFSYFLCRIVQMPKDVSYPEPFLVPDSADIN